METQKRLQQQEKVFDHHVRAIHLEEMLERKAVMMQRIAEAPKAHEEYENRRIQKAMSVNIEIELFFINMFQRCS